MQEWSAMETGAFGAQTEKTPEWLPLECYTEDEVVVGRIKWPVGQRLLDLLNSLYMVHRDSSGEFLDVIDIAREGGDSRTLVSKSAVRMIAISNSDLARGAGGGISQQYPFVKKSEITVSVKLKTHNVNGAMHLAAGEDIQDVLNRDVLFVPVTDATLATSENHFYGTRPFVAVNKRHIVWVRVE
jgi:hypothetical protein